MYRPKFIDRQTEPDLIKQHIGTPIEQKLETIESVYKEISEPTHPVFIAMEKKLSPKSASSKVLICKFVKG